MNRKYNCVALFVLGLFCFIDARASDSFDKPFVTVIPITKHENIRIPHGFCSGTLIDERVVVTAGHCISLVHAEEDLMVVHGDLSTPIQEMQNLPALNDPEALQLRDLYQSKKLDADQYAASLLLSHLTKRNLAIETNQFHAWKDLSDLATNTRRPSITDIPVDFGIIELKRAIKLPSYARIKVQPDFQVLHTAEDALPSHALYPRPKRCSSDRSLRKRQECISWAASIQSLNRNRAIVAGYRNWGMDLINNRLFRNSTLVGLGGERLSFREQTGSELTAYPHSWMLIDGLQLGANAFGRTEVLLPFYISRSGFGPADSGGFLGMKDPSGYTMYGVIVQGYVRDDNHYILSNPMTERVVEWIREKLPHVNLIVEREYDQVPFQRLLKEYRTNLWSKFTLDLSH